jgi:hypothetical protein
MDAAFITMRGHSPNRRARAAKRWRTAAAIGPGRPRASSSCASPDFIASTAMRARHPTRQM